MRATEAERQKKSRGAKAKAGLIRIEVWAKPEHREAIKSMAAKLVNGD